jgi:hypothetical protein
MKRSDNLLAIQDARRAKNNLAWAGNVAIMAAIFAGHMAKRARNLYLT